MNLLNFLKSVDLFRELTPEALQDVSASAVKRQHWPGGHFLFRQGEPAEACYVLVSGQAHLIQLDTQGHEVALHVVEPGHVLGITTLLEEGAYSTSAQVTQTSSGLVWSRSEIQRLLRRHPTILSNALHIAMSRYTELQHAYQQLAFETVDRRLAGALVRLAHAVQPEPNGEIVIRGAREQFAALAVTTVPTASRLLSEWERRGWLTSGRMVVIVKDLAALEGGMMIPDWAWGVVDLALSALWRDMVVAGPAALPGTRTREVASQHIATAASHPLYLPRPRYALIGKVGEKRAWGEEGERAIIRRRAASVHAVRGHYRRHEYVAERRQDEQAKEQLKRLREAAAARAAQFGLPAPPPGYTFVSPFMRGVGQGEEGEQEARALHARGLAALAGVLATRS